MSEVAASPAEAPLSIAVVEDNDTLRELLVEDGERIDHGKALLVFQAEPA